MTVKRDLKRIIRARMARTGEPFTTARQHVLRARREQQEAAGEAPPEEAGAAGEAGTEPGADAGGAVDAARGEAPAQLARARAAVLDAAVLRRGARSARVRVLATGEELTVRARDLWHVMPGHVVTLVVERRSRKRGQVYAAGEVRGARIDVPALGLLPLGVHERGPLDTVPIRAGEPEALRELLAKIAAAPRAAYEMEQVLPQAGPGDDPILESIARRQRGDVAGAARLLMEVVSRDLRCLDAHAHLGNLVFPAFPEHALLHYEIGMAIGDHALGPGFVGALPWGWVDNRPFLRCLHGLGLALWRLGRMEEAGRAFERLLWLNPADQQSAGRCWIDVRAGKAWDD